jgi:hypothetical protein
VVGGVTLHDNATTEVHMHLKLRGGGSSTPISILAIAQRVASAISEVNKGSLQQVQILW